MSRGVGTALKRSALLLVLVARAVAATAGQDSDGIAPAPVVDLLDGAADSGARAVPRVILPERYRAAPDAVPANGGVVYFTPQDENTSVSCLFLQNHGTADAAVALTTWDLAGAVVIDTTINVPVGELVRVCSDTVSTISGTWQSVALVNFTTFSTYARLVLPPGVEVEDGYVAWNNSSTYDPLVAAPTLKLRFVREMPRPITVRFTPQDENTSVTCLFLYNVSSAAADVGIQTFNLDGSQTLSTSIPVPSHGLVRVCADAVTSVSSTWQSVVLANFTTFSTYGVLTLPAGVMADGYVAWAGAVNYDPLLVVPTAELRFNTNLIFLDGFDSGDAGEWDGVVH